MNTPPTTVVGIAALCRYIAPFLNDPDNCDFPDVIEWDDDTVTTPAGSFASIMAAAVQAVIGGQS